MKSNSSIHGPKLTEDCHPERREQTLHKLINVLLRQLGLLCCEVVPMLLLAAFAKLKNKLHFYHWLRGHPLRHSTYQSAPIHPTCLARRSSMNPHRIANLSTCLNTDLVHAPPSTCLNVDLVHVPQSYCQPTKSMHL